MAKQVTIGGDRLGAGKKMKTELNHYNRSTHNIGFIKRTTMSAGTLVPFMNNLMLPGDTFDIKLDVDIMTHPTVGPLFGSYKVQMDVFCVPIRLYIAALHNNDLNVGNKMSDIKIPQIQLEGNNPLWGLTSADEVDYDNLDNLQINPASILRYQGIAGLGWADETVQNVERQVSALKLLGYWDIYKNYYANKQEGIGAVIHNHVVANVQTVTSVENYNGVGSFDPVPQAPITNPPNPSYAISASTFISFNYTGATPNITEIVLRTDMGEYLVKDIFTTPGGGVGYETMGDPRPQFIGTQIINWRYANANDLTNQAPVVWTFPLDDIDKMRTKLLTQPKTAPYIIDSTETLEPYRLLLETAAGATGEPNLRSILGTQEGLGLKTYQSDMFNNWMDSDWIDGTNGVNEVTKIDTTGGSFTIDQFIISKKVWDMLNQVAVMGGSYFDWVEGVYDHEPRRLTSIPMYMGGLSKELVFQAVISNSAASDEGEAQPLGTLGGRGVMSGKHKGGYVTITADEPSYAIGIISLTPRTDYSQGNEWDNNLKTIDDLHKPALDGIGFQDDIVDQRAWWDTNLQVPNIPVYRSAGKLPAWMNYMTDVNRTYGNFAVENNEMFMTLNRRFEPIVGVNTHWEMGLQDLTTYIDPVKFNHIFAQTSIDAMNFWVQVGAEITARRKMSAKIMPNL